MPDPDHAPLGMAEELRHRIEEEVRQQYDQELVLLRTKLEVRTWFLRASLAVNMGVVAAIVTKFLL